MENIWGVIKQTILSTFFLLNLIDMLQTVSFLNMGTESNQFAVHYPYLWFPFKFAFAFGFSIGLYWLDGYLMHRENEGTHGFLKMFVGLAYLIVFFADIFFLFLVMDNASILGRLF